MANGNDDNGQTSEGSVHAYRIEQLEKQVAELRSSSGTLKFEQIKQMFLWLGLPVAVATGVFGVALWQIIEAGTTAVAEKRTAETMASLTSDIREIQTEIQAQQEESEEASIDLRVAAAIAQESAISARDLANQAEERAIAAGGALTRLQQVAASAADIELALGNVEEISDQIAQNKEFQQIVSGTALAGLTGLVAAFDLREGCPVGWSQFEHAAGRVIVGVGQGSIDRVGDQDIPLTERRWRDFGGEETHKLMVAEMPRHFHGVRGSLGEGGSLPLHWVDNPQVERAVMTDAPHSNPQEDERRRIYDGAGQPHNNMPPYIALYYCKKNE